MAVRNIASASTVAAFVAALGIAVGYWIQGRYDWSAAAIGAAAALLIVTWRAGNADVGIGGKLALFAVSALIGAALTAVFVAGFFVVECQAFDNCPSLD